MNDKILLRKPYVGRREQRFVSDALASGWVAPAGPDLTGFEADLASELGVSPDNVLCLSSGTAALQLGLIELGVTAGDDVIVQTATFAATAFAVAHIGANPVFCDVDEITGNLCPERLEFCLRQRALSNNLPAAVVPVDLFGYAADYDSIDAVCKQFGVPVLQDAAEALGTFSQGKAAATHGNLGVLSFNGNKIITTSGGGALVGPAETLAHARHLSTQARDNATWYEHTEIGFNYRMSNILAAVGRAQLERLGDFIETRRRAHDYYVDALPHVDWFPEGVTDQWNHWLSVALLPEGTDAITVCQELQSKGIEARPYWKPMHMQPVFAKNETIGGETAEMFFRRGICLPSGVALNLNELNYVATSLSAAVRESKLMSA